MLAHAHILPGRLNQAEYSERIDPILAGPGDKDHLHNNLIAAIYGNVTREMPDQGLAPWVSANDKPAATTGTKPVSGDAAERRLKGDVMQLPTRDRRRIKDLVQNDVGIFRSSLFQSLTGRKWDPHESISNVFADSHRKPSTVAVSDATPTVGGINNMSMYYSDVCSLCGGPNMRARLRHRDSKTTCTTIGNRIWRISRHQHDIRPNASLLLRGRTC